MKGGDGITTAATMRPRCPDTKGNEGERLGKRSNGQRKRRKLKRDAVMIIGGGPDRNQTKDLIPGGRGSEIRKGVVITEKTRKG